MAEGIFSNQLVGKDNGKIALLNTTSYTMVYHSFPQQTWEPGEN